MARSRGQITQTRGEGQPGRSRFLSDAPSPRDSMRYPGQLRSFWRRRAKNKRAAASRRRNR